MTMDRSISSKVYSKTSPDSCRNTPTVVSNGIDSRMCSRTRRLSPNWPDRFNGSFRQVWPYAFTSATELKFLYPPLPRRIVLNYTRTYISLKSAPKTSAVKRWTSVCGSCQASGARPALCAQQFERNSSLDQPASGATWGRKQPDARPFFM